MSVFNGPVQRQPGLFYLGKVPPCGARGRCPFLSDQKGTKESPGDGSDERLRGAGAHSHLSPGPPVAGAGTFGCLVNSGGQNQDLFPSYSRPLGPFAIKI